MRIAQEEIFGPTTALIPVESFEEAVAAANSVSYGLSSSIFTRDVNRAFRAMRDLQTGITYINAGTTGAEVHLPVRRHQGHRQRPPRGGAGRARRLHRVEVDLRRLLGQAPAGPDRQRVNRKLVVFVPPRRARTPCATAVFAAGAGRIGDYEHCSWYTDGHRHLPRRCRARIPTVGEVGRGAACRRATGSRRCSPRSARTTVVAALRARAPLRGARLRHLRAPVKARPLHRRRRPRQPRPGRLRLRPRGRGRRPARGRGRRDRHRRRTTSPSTAASSPASTRAVELEVTDLEVRSDSELMVKQMRGEYRVKNEALRALSLEAAAASPACSARVDYPTSRASRTSSPTGSSTTRSTASSLTARGYTRGTRM